MMLYYLLRGKVSLLLHDVVLPIGRKVSLSLHDVVVRKLIIFSSIQFYSSLAYKVTSLSNNSVKI